MYMQGPLRSKDIGSPETRVKDSCESREHWESNLSALEEQQVHLRAEPSLQPQEIFIYLFILLVLGENHLKFFLKIRIAFCFDSTKFTF